MEENISIQGRILKSSDIKWIRELLSLHPDWNRTRISREICRVWNWRNYKGLLKDMASRTMLLKLERQGLICLPPSQIKTNINAARLVKLPQPKLDQTPFHENLQHLWPLTVTPIQSKDKVLFFNSVLKYHHYLSFKTPVGQNLKYLVYSRNNRLLACVLFGSAAWKTAPRDIFIGWNGPTREKNLHHISNNMRFLILPWIRVKNLASHILATISKRISDDWQDKYGHPIYLLETFVEIPRFKGCCYEAANWKYVGDTTGRTRNGLRHEIIAPPKKIFVYPLHHQFRTYLNHQ